MRQLSIPITALALCSCASFQIPPDLAELNLAVVAESVVQANCPRSQAELLALYTARREFDARTNVSAGTRAVIDLLRAQTNVVCGIVT